jgi:hypothetical protein
MEWGGPPWAAAGPLAGLFFCGARPRVVLRRLDQPRLDRVLLDVRSKPIELLAIPHPMIVALLLPEGLAGQAQDLIGPLGGNSLERSQQLGQGHLRGDQQVEVIGHPQRTGTGLVEQPVHGHEGLSGSQAPVQTASHEQRLAEGLPRWGVLSGARSRPGGRLRSRGDRPTPQNVETPGRACPPTWAWVTPAGAPAWSWARRRPDSRS